jgi:hypothetical protein
MTLAERATGMLKAPAAEWPRVATEPATEQSIYTGYVMVLAAIGPVVLLLSSLVFGVPGAGFGLRIAISLYVTTLVSVAVIALVADALAPSFDGTRDYLRSFKLVAYSFTPAWLAQLALFVPILGGLVALLGTIYAFYLFFIGAPVLRRCTPDKAAAYTLVVVLCTIVLMFVLRALIFGLINTPTAAGPVGLIR